MNRTPWHQQARDYHRQLDNITREVAATLIRWSHHPSEAPTTPNRWCATLDSKLATDEERAAHDAEDCKWCPTTTPRVQIARTEVSRPVEQAVAAGDTAVGEVIGVFEQQMEHLMSYRHGIFKDEWWPTYLNAHDSRFGEPLRLYGAQSDGFDRAVVALRNATLSASSDVAGWAERMNSECPITYSPKTRDAWHGWQDDHVRVHASFLGDVVHQYRRLAKRWGISERRPLPSTIRRCIVDGCHRALDRYPRTKMCNAHYQANRKAAS